MNKPRPKRTGCGKRYFRDRIAAELALAAIARSPRPRAATEPVRAYKCPHGDHWHLTHFRTPPRPRAIVEGSSNPQSESEKRMRTRRER